jgi:DNA-binding LacI/PurR family transcriptional regulator
MASNPLSQSSKKRVRLADVARAAGVSPATVSMALRDHPEIALATREKVKRITASLGYSGPHIRTPAPGIDASPRRYGLLVLHIHDNPYIQALLDGLSQAADHRANRIEVHVINDITNRKRVAERTLNFISSVDGLLASGWIERHVLELLDQQNVPFVTIGPFYSDPLLLPPALNRAVMFDTRAMGLLATRHLLAQGHKRIGFLAELLPRHMFNSGWLDGYRLAMLDAGLSVNKDLIYIGTGSGTGDQLARSVAKIKSKPTAFVTPSAPAAALFLRTLRALGTRLDPKNLVVSGSLETLAEYRLSNHPAIVRSIHDLASHALKRLHHSVVEGKPTLGTWTIPFTTHNMDLSLLE